MKAGRAQARLESRRARLKSSRTAITAGRPRNPPRRNHPLKAAGSTPGRFRRPGAAHALGPLKRAGSGPTRTAGGPSPSAGKLGPCQGRLPFQSSRPLPRCLAASLSLLRAVNRGRVSLLCLPNPRCLARSLAPLSTPSEHRTSRECDLDHLDDVLPAHELRVPEDDRCVHFIRPHRQNLCIHTRMRALATFTSRSKGRRCSSRIG